MKRREGFLLIELIVAMPIAVMLALASVALLFLTSRGADRAADEIAAHDRARAAFALIRPMAAACGLGMRDDRIIFLNGRLDVSYHMVNISGSRRRRDDGRLRLCYAEPSGIVLADDLRTSDEEFFIEIFDTDGELEAMGLTTESLEAHGRYWPGSYLAPSASLPREALRITMMPTASSIADARMRVERAAPDGELSIARGDELCLFRAAEIRSDPAGGLISHDWALYIDDLMGGDQPRVMGIMDARFEIDEEAGVLRVKVLARGDVRRGGEGRLIDWPQELAADLPPTARAWDLYGYETSFRLYNY